MWPWSASSKITWESLSEMRTDQMWNNSNWEKIEATLHGSKQKYPIKYESELNRFWKYSLFKLQHKVILNH